MLIENTTLLKKSRRKAPIKRLYSLSSQALSLIEPLEKTNCPICENIIIPEIYEVFYIKFLYKRHIFKDVN